MVPVAVPSNMSCIESVVTGAHLYSQVLIIAKSFDIPKPLLRLRSSHLPGTQMTRPRPRPGSSSASPTRATWSVWPPRSTASSASWPCTRGRPSFLRPRGGADDWAAAAANAERFAELELFIFEPWAPGGGERGGGRGGGIATHCTAAVTAASRRTSVAPPPPPPPVAPPPLPPLPPLLPKAAEAIASAASRARMSGVPKRPRLAASLGVSSPLGRLPCVAVQCVDSSYASCSCTPGQPENVGREAVFLLKNFLQVDVYARES